jgi:hypothetical protein
MSRPHHYRPRQTCRCQNQPSKYKNEIRRQMPDGGKMNNDTSYETRNYCVSVSVLHY